MQTRSFEAIVLGNQNLAEHPRLAAFVDSYQQALDDGLQPDPRLLSDMFAVLLEIVVVEQELAASIDGLELSIAEEVLVRDPDLATNPELSALLGRYAEAVNTGEVEVSEETTTAILGNLDGVDTTGLDPDTLMALMDLEDALIPFDDMIDIGGLDVIDSILTFDGLSGNTEITGTVDAERIFIAGDAAFLDASGGTTEEGPDTLTDIGDDVIHVTVDTTGTLQRADVVILSGDATEIVGGGATIETGSDNLLLINLGSIRVVDVNGDAQTLTFAAAGHLTFGDDTILASSFGSISVRGDLDTLRSTLAETSVTFGNDVIDVSARDYNVSGDVGLIRDWAGGDLVFGDDVITIGDGGRFGTRIAGDAIAAVGSVVPGYIVWGNDTIVSGSGRDFMAGDTFTSGLRTGPGGLDTFVFLEKSGTDIIHDFEVGHDLADLTALGLSGFGDLQIDGNGTSTVLVTLNPLEGGTDTIEFRNMTEALSADDFLF